MIPTSHQLLGLPQRALLTEGREAKLHRLCDSLWKELRSVRQERSAIALHNALKISREIQSLGFSVVIFSKGKVVSVNDPRFADQPLILAQEKPLATRTPPKDRFLGLRDQFAQLPLEEQELLLKEIHQRLKRSRTRVIQGD